MHIYFILFLPNKSYAHSTDKEGMGITHTGQYMHTAPSYSHPHHGVPNSPSTSSFPYTSSSSSVKTSTSIFSSMSSSATTNSSSSPTSSSHSHLVGSPLPLLLNPNDGQKSHYALPLPLSSRSVIEHIQSHVTIETLGYGKVQKEFKNIHRIYRMFSVFLCNRFFSYLLISSIIIN